MEAVDGTEFGPKSVNGEPPSKLNRAASVANSWISQAGLTRLLTVNWSI